MAVSLTLHTGICASNRMREAVGSIGNSCMHLTDDQSRELEMWRSGQGTQSKGGGMACDSSYAYHCARILLNPYSIAFLNELASSCVDISDASLLRRFKAYTDWLGDPTFADVDCAGRFAEPPEF